MPPGYPGVPSGTPNAPGGYQRSTYTPPWWVEPLIDAGMAVAGGMYSNRQNKKASERAYEQQKEFAQHGIRWRVEDAKAAGLHPLYALGAQPLQFSPSFAMDSVGPALGSAGQSVGRAIGAQQTAMERRANELALLLAESQIKETDARALLARAEALRALRDGRGTPNFPDVNMPEAGLIGATASTAGGAELVAPKVMMSRPDNSGVAAGPGAPGMREYRLPNGQPILLPAANDIGEAIEPLAESYGMAAMVYKLNKDYYGSEWTAEFGEQFKPDWWKKADNFFRSRYLRSGESSRGRYRSPRSYIDKRLRYLNPR